MSNESFMALPNNMEDPVVTKRALQRVIEELDKVLGNRGNEPYLTISALEGVSEQTRLSLTEIAELIEALQKLVEELQVNDLTLEELIESAATAIDSLQQANKYVSLNSAYYDLNATEWADLAQRGFFSALGSAVLNPPVALTPASTYNIYVDTAPTPGGGVVTDLTIEDVTTPTLTAYRRAGNTFALAVSNGWLAI